MDNIFYMCTFLNSTFTFGTGTFLRPCLVTIVWNPFHFLVVAQMVVEPAALKLPTRCTTPWRTEPTGATWPPSQVSPGPLRPPSWWKAWRREQDTWGFSTSLPLPVLTLLWKTKLGGTSQRAAQQRPLPPVVRRAPPVRAARHRQNLIYWQAAPSMTTRCIYGDGTGFRVTLQLKYRKLNQWQVVARDWTISSVILKEEMKLKYCMNMVSIFQVFTVREWRTITHLLYFKAKLYYV